MSEWTPPEEENIEKEEPDPSISPLSTEKPSPRIHSFRTDRPQKEEAPQALVDRTALSNHLDRSRATASKEYSLDLGKTDFAPGGMRVDFKLNDKNLDLTFRTDSQKAQTHLKKEEGSLREALAKHDFKVSDVRVEDAGRGSFSSQQERNRPSFMDFRENSGRKDQAQLYDLDDAPRFNPGKSYNLENSKSLWTGGRHRPISGQSTIALRV